MRPIHANNDITNPITYKAITSSYKGSGVLSEVYGCDGKEFFVIGRNIEHIFLWDGDEWKTKVRSAAKTYKKDAGSVLIGGSKSWNDVKHSVPSINA